MKIKVWCDSGANAQSKREEVINLDDLGLTKEEWDNMFEDQKEAAIKEIALSQFDWGFEEIE